MPLYLALCGAGGWDPGKHSALHAKPPSVLHSLSSPLQVLVLFLSALKILKATQVRCKWLNPVMTSLRRLS